ncbi:uncharacterized protein LOC113146814 [Cyclospora cayetanensis]|uniref:Uncharacterized protein LOC113146814 n=1 Tax=Cyclospora cayetanensis TaxID=88456 RepID=A0A6P6RU83_9EIME|nr:uncharacterized protein LOC113146814 [Cyclospora cayetanensis]
MARVLSIVALGLFCSLPSTLAVRTKLTGEQNEEEFIAFRLLKASNGVSNYLGRVIHDSPGQDLFVFPTPHTTVDHHGVHEEDDNSNSEVAFDGDGSVEESSLSSKPEFIEANCGILTVLGGLAIDESVKVTANGWENETLDFIVYLVSDDTSSSAQSRLAKSNTVQQVSEESEDEHVAEPILAVRIPGVQGDKEKSNEGPAVLLYQSDPSNPTEIPLDTPAGPTTPFMIILKQLSYTEMQVTVYTWISGRVSRRSATGRWHSTAVNAGTGMQARNFRLHVNNSAPKALRVYGPRSGNWLTAEEGTCDQVDPPLVEVVPSTEAEPEVVLEAEPEVAAEAELLAKAHVATSASQEEP